jgi:hypothetical protein
LKTFQEELKLARAQRLPTNGKLYGEAMEADFAEAFAVHKALGRDIAPQGGRRRVSASTELAWRQADQDYRYFIGILNEDRMTKGLPPIEF